jgi:WXG100 family type VII secretion target
MNPDVVEAQAHILHGLSHELTALMNKIEAEVRSLAEAWHGADATAFIADWAGTHKPVFTTAATLLATMGDTSLRNAGQQQATSSH